MEKLGPRSMWIVGSFAFVASSLIRGGFLNFALARQAVETFTPQGKVRFFDDQNGKAVLDLETQGAALAFQMILLESQAGIAGTEGATQNVEQILGDHAARSCT
jgi:hypothetical protein